MSSPFEDDPPWPEGASNVHPLPVKLVPQDKRRPIDWAALAGLEPPPRKWAEKGWFGFGHTTLLVGQGGIGKTLLSQQWGSALALNHGLLGEPEGHFRVLMWACEDDHDELWRRQIAIARWLDAGLEAFENLHIIPRHGLENALVSTEFGKLMFAPLLEELREQAADLDAQVVILDNVAQLYGGNENDRHSVTVFLNALAGALPGRAILLLAHPARSAGSEFSGSSAWENTARTRLYLGAKLPGEKQDDDESAEDVRYLSRRKSNYSTRDWRKLNYRDGVLIPEAQEAQGGIVAEIRSRNAETIVKAGLQRLLDMGLQPAAGHNSPRYLPKMLAEYKLDQGADKKDLTAALRALMVSGAIINGTVGHRSDNRNPIAGLQVCTK